MIYIVIASDSATDRLFTTGDGAYAFDCYEGNAVTRCGPELLVELLVALKEGVRLWIVGKTELCWVAARQVNW